jgi:hypothetical protein
VYADLDQSAQMCILSLVSNLSFMILCPDDVIWTKILMARLI